MCILHLTLLTQFHGLVNHAGHETRLDEAFREKCVVRGDRATGFHYTVASCNGCKTFFSRTILCKRRFKCNKDGNCEFDKDMRCACRACRFPKCVQVGMNPAAIQGNRPPQVVALNRSGSAKALVHSTREESPCSTKWRPMTPLSGPSTSVASPSPREEVKAFAIGVAECDEMISTMLNVDALMSQLKCLHFAGGPLLDILTTPPAIERIHDIQQSSPPSFFSEEKRIEHWLNFELIIATEWMKTHAVFRKLTFFDKASESSQKLCCVWFQCTLMEETTVAVVLLNSACHSALRGENELRYPDGSPMRFNQQCGNVCDLVNVIIRSSMDKAMFVLMRTLTFLNADSLGLTDDGRTKIYGERRRIMHALGTYIFHRHGKASPGVLGDLLSLSATALSFGRRVRLSPPAPAPLLFVKGPLPPLTA